MESKNNLVIEYHSKNSSPQNEILFNNYSQTFNSKSSDRYPDIRSNSTDIWLIYSTDLLTTTNTKKIISMKTQPCFKTFQEKKDQIKDYMKSNSSNGINVRYLIFSLI